MSTISSTYTEVDQDFGAGGRLYEGRESNVAVSMYITYATVLEKAGVMNL